MEHDETGCGPPPDGPILCANKCGFFGSSANMNLCSVCYKVIMQNEETAKHASLSIQNITNGTSSSNVASKHIVAEIVGKKAVPVEVVITGIASSLASSSIDEADAPIAKEGPSRCDSCMKKVGLTGFRCRCGITFCGLHRSSDKHDCQYDYRTSSQEAIAKANPVIKAKKLDKI